MEKGLHPDVVYINGDVVMLDKSNSQAEAVATWHDKIVAVGSTVELQKMAGLRTKIVNLGGKTLVPGLIEPHNHFIAYGPMALMRMNLSSPPIGQIKNIKEYKS